SRICTPSAGTRKTTRLRCFTLTCATAPPMWATRRWKAGRSGASRLFSRMARGRFNAVQHELVTPPFRIVGTIANINPNNSNDMSFELVKPDGSRITREDLKNAKPKDLDAQS